MAALLKIEDYLQVTDWDFSLELERGKIGRFHWLRYEYLPIFDLFDTVDLFDIIELPSSPFQVIVTRYAYAGGARNYGAWDGWRHIGEFAIIGPVSTMPQLEYDLDSAQIVIDGSHSDAQIENALRDFAEPQSLTDRLKPSACISRKSRKRDGVSGNLLVQSLVLRSASRRAATGLRYSYRSAVSYIICLIGSIYQSCVKIDAE